MAELFPPIEPFRSFRLKVSPVHELHVEESGNPQGVPAVLLHGGPGAGIAPLHRRFFDPGHWRVVLFDQRGSGKSTPLGELFENETGYLIEDMERIREHLGIEKWLVFGGSWGSTLAIAYAEKHPERVTGLILRGIFLGRRSEVLWTMGGGAERILPDGFRKFISILSEEERKDVLGSYRRRLLSTDRATVVEAALHWNRWEDLGSYLLPPPDPDSYTDEELEAEVALARIECHYFSNSAFLATDDQLLRDVGRLRKIPGVIIQARYDLVCPMTSAWELHEAWPEARFRMVSPAGHSAGEPIVASALVEETERFRTEAAL